MRWAGRGDGRAIGGSRRRRGHGDSCATTWLCKLAVCESDGRAWLDAAVAPHHMTAPCGGGCGSRLLPAAQPAYQPPSSTPPRRWYSWATSRRVKLASLRPSSTHPLMRPTQPPSASISCPGRCTWTTAPCDCRYGTQPGRSASGRSYQATSGTRPWLSSCTTSRVRGAAFARLLGLIHHRVCTSFGRARRPQLLQQREPLG